MAAVCCSNSRFCCDISQDVAELEKEELQCKVEVSPAAVRDSTSTLSEYSTLLCSMLQMVFTLYADIADLAKVKRFLKNIHDWQLLGLELGLLYPTLKRIKKEQQGDINDCMMEMLAAWLQQQDGVSQHGIPSWSVLQTALVNLGEIQLASEISTQRQW